MSSKAIAFIGLGSNLGNRKQHLCDALDAMAPFITITCRSGIYETEPVGYAAQGWFLNMVVKGETALSPQDLLAELKNVEQTLGRKKTVCNGPRCIDLDILFYNDLVYRDETLHIPHPELHNRAFVLVPLCDIAADLVHPALGITIQGLHAAHSDPHPVQPWESDT